MKKRKQIGWGWVHDDDEEQEEGMKKMMNDWRMKMMNCVMKMMMK